MINKTWKTTEKKLSEVEKWPDWREMYKLLRNEKQPALCELIFCKARQIKERFEWKGNTHYAVYTHHFLSAKTFIPLRPWEDAYKRQNYTTGSENSSVIQKNRQVTRSVYIFILNNILMCAFIIDINGCTGTAVHSKHHHRSLIDPLYNKLTSKPVWYGALNLLSGNSVIQQFRLCCKA